MEENIALENKKTLISTRILKKKTKKKQLYGIKSTIFHKFFFVFFLLLMEFAIAVVIQGLDAKEEQDFDITYGACLSRRLFIICRKCSRATFESGLSQCSFQLILCRSFLNFIVSL